VACLLGTRRGTFRPWKNRWVGSWLQSPRLFRPKYENCELSSQTGIADDRCCPRLLHEEIFNSLPYKGMNRVMLSTESHHEALSLR
jgi:hypothetical protein